MKRLRLLFLASLAGLAAAPAAAFTPGASSPPAAELSRRPLPEDEYAESLTFLAYLPGGVRVETGVQVTNLGLGKGNGSFLVEVITRGRTYQARASVGRSFQWDPQDAAGPLAVAMQHKDARASVRTVSGQPGQVGHVVEVSGASKELRYTLRFTAQLPAWRPGSGQLPFRGRTFAYGVDIPRARVDADVEVGGRRVQASGVGLMEHGRSNVDPRQHTDRQLRLRVLDQLDGQPLTVLAYDHVTTPRDGERRFGFVVAFLGQRALVTRLGPVLSGQDLAPDPLRPKNQVPRRLVIDLPELRLTARTARQVERNDYLDSMSGLVRLIVSRYVHPVAYNYDCEAELELSRPDGAPLRRSGWADCGASLMRP